MKLRSLAWIAIGLVCYVSNTLAADHAVGHDELLFFENRVRPVLATRCLRCHGPNQQKGELRLDSHAGLMAGGELGAAVDAENPALSLILNAISYEDADLQMPPDGKLPESDIVALRKWILMGAPWPNIDPPPLSDSQDGENLPASTDHWSFQPVQSLPVPTVQDQVWCANDFDHFILRDIEAEGLRPSAPATPRQLVRRLYFHLIGLPPTPEEVAAFQADPSMAAYEDLVNRLLAMPQYGERWGRHWLDVVRYAETNGIASDKRKANAWRYRDYVIQSLNEDKPYDRFLWEQLAGDEFPHPTSDSVVATGFYRLALYQKLGESRQHKLKRLEKFVQLDDIARAISEGMLGLTIGCARCHDHKFDPISQQDYYSLLAFLSNIVPIDQDQPVPLVDVERYERDHAAQKTLRDALDRLQKKAAELEAKASDQLIREQLSDEEWHQYQEARELDFRKRSVDQRQLFERVENELAPDLDDIHASLAADVQWQKLQAEIAARRSEQFPEALAVREYGASPEPMYLLVRGDIDSPRELCSPRFPAVLTYENPQRELRQGGSEHTVRATDDGLLAINSQPSSLRRADSFAASLLQSRGKTSGQRTRLAAWVTDPRNPLTARVIVNRVVQHHFGRGIVATPNDFGSMGVPPTHPELLDWLATWFVDHDWSLKKLHKLIVMSSTYRQSSEFQDEQSERLDPTNSLLRRQNLQRLEAEAIRDSMLYVSGQLNPQMGGQSFYPALSRELITLAKGSWGRSGRRDRARRSVYTFVKRTLKDPFLELFDYNNFDQSVGRRNVSTVAPQALLLLNSQFTHEQTVGMASRLLQAKADSPHELIQHAFALALQREATEDEQSACAELFDHDRVSREAAEVLALVVLNLNEFVYVD